MNILTLIKGRFDLPLVCLLFVAALFLEYEEAFTIIEDETISYRHLVRSDYGDPGIIEPSEDVTVVYTDEAFYDDLKKYYSSEEIVELGTYIGINIGFHTFFGTLDFYPMFAPDGRLVSQEESKEIYGTTPVSHTEGAMERALELAPDTAAE